MADSPPNPEPTHKPRPRSDRLAIFSKTCRTKSDKTARLSPPQPDNKLPQNGLPSRESQETRTASDRELAAACRKCLKCGCEAFVSPPRNNTKVNIDKGLWRCLGCGLSVREMLGHGTEMQPENDQSSKAKNPLQSDKEMLSVIERKATTPRQPYSTPIINYTVGSSAPPEGPRHRIGSTSGSYEVYSLIGRCTPKNGEENRSPEQINKDAKKDSTGEGHFLHHGQDEQQEWKAGTNRSGDVYAEIHAKLLHTREQQRVRDEQKALEALTNQEHAQINAQKGLNEELSVNAAQIGAAESRVQEIHIPVGNLVRQNLGQCPDSEDRPEPGQRPLNYLNNIGARGNYEMTVNKHHFVQAQGSSAARDPKDTYNSYSQYGHPQKNTIDVWGESPLSKPRHLADVLRREKTRASKVDLSILHEDRSSPPASGNKYHGQRAVSPQRNITEPHRDQPHPDTYRQISPLIDGIIQPPVVSSGAGSLSMDSVGQEKSSWNPQVNPYIPQEYQYFSQPSGTMGGWFNGALQSPWAEDTVYAEHMHIGYGSQSYQFSLTPEVKSPLPKPISNATGLPPILYRVYDHSSASRYTWEGFLATSPCIPTTQSQFKAMVECHANLKSRARTPFISLTTSVDVVRRHVNRKRAHGDFGNTMVALIDTATLIGTCGTYMWSMHEARDHFNIESNFTRRQVYDYEYICGIKIPARAIFACTQPEYFMTMTLAFLQSRA